MNEDFFTKLRIFFIAGYTLPQYCIDNGIKKPLFVSEREFLSFLWEIHVQFVYDKRMLAQFSILDMPAGKVNFFNMLGSIRQMNYENFSDVNPDNFDAIILLTTEKIEINDKVITLDKLMNQFINKIYAEIPTLNFLQRYPKVKLIMTNFPKMPNDEEALNFKEELLSLEDIRKILREDKSGNIETKFDKFGYTNKDVLNLTRGTRIKTNLDGSTTMADIANPLINIKNGKRVTAYQPEHFYNKIYIVGTCHQYGIDAPYDKTIASYLQKMLNDNNLPYRVENESQRYARRYQDIFYNLNKINPAPDDIIFLYIHRLRVEGVPYFDVSDAFDPPHDYKEIFPVRGHVNELGYKLVAEKYFKFLTENNFFRDVEFNYPVPPPAQHRYGIPPWVEQGGVNIFVNKELETYKKQLKARRPQIGALVMNCNPFTLGHLHLVEYAVAKVVKLYIFVVEEDKSEFPFADRIELVRQGVKKFSNVEVLPSGKFIISQQTFSGYFNKASLQDVAVDSSEDVEIFGKEIAPTLGITVRFAGEEPKDNVTRQYNETMKKILPRYGVEFCEIPRKEFSGEPISASTVRAALKNGDIDKVKSLVPDTTFDYLCKHHTEFKRYFTARIDVKLVTTTGDFQILSITDKKARIRKPIWYQKGGIGYLILSYAGKLDFVAKTTMDGQIRLNLRGINIRNPKDKSKRIPYWIDYTKLTINEQIIFDTVTPVWHDKPYPYNINVKADEEIKIQVEWLPHNN